LETQVLTVLRTADAPVTAAWVQERLDAELAYTTVMTVLSRLLEKQAVTRVREGRSFAWSPAADEAVLASFITALPEDDEQLLRDLLDQATDESAG
jgi:predicted transcriptional regulator